MPAKCITPQSVADESEAEIARLTAANKELADALRELFARCINAPLAYRGEFPKSDLHLSLRTAREALAKHAK